MEDTLTCSHATFSQVFGRQGQLMQASEWQQLPALFSDQVISRLHLPHVGIADLHHLQLVFALPILSLLAVLI